MTGELDKTLPAPVAELVRRCTGAPVRSVSVVQTLWSGYGYILRCHLRGGDAPGTIPSVIVKHVRWPSSAQHPRGWNSSRSHERKVRSYEVETAWYSDFAARCGEACRVPKCLAAMNLGDGVAIVLEDLDAVGFGARRGRVDEDAQDVEACLTWLAEFHATFMGTAPAGLWEVGTYWHLATRPDEFAALSEGPLKDSAAAIDRVLSASRFQTLVHGDAKLANFCFSSEAGAGASAAKVAAVDFQYVGGGCGMKDVAYFVSSCFGEDEAQRRETAVLEVYFSRLRDALTIRKGVDIDALCEEWRGLYALAWTDFYRFLKGWSPGHWKIHRYSERLARQALEEL